MFIKRQLKLESIFKSLIISTTLVNKLVFIDAAEKHRPHIFVVQCLKQHPNLPSTYVPYTVLSLCHLKDIDKIVLEQNDTTNLKPIPRFSHHSFFITFENIPTLDDVYWFRSLYERLFIPWAQRSLFEYIGKHYQEFKQNNPYEVKQELLRRRWNLDEFLILNSEGAYHILRYNENQYPTFIQKQDERYKTNNVSDLPLSYVIQSGYGQQCTHNSRQEKLRLLTQDFTAYDRLFCDAFEFHNLQHKIHGYWNPDDMYYFRGRLVRDGLVSSFPPDTSTAVYYGSPQLTFVILQRHPITWLFVTRPFKKSLWVFLIVTFFMLETIRHLNQFLDFLHRNQIKRKMIQRKLFAMIMLEDQGKLDEISGRYINMLGIFNGILRIMLASAYSGMILVGILHPLYPPTPETFKELNRTTNYYIGTAIHSPSFIYNHTVVHQKLNQMKRNMVWDRELITPAEYLERAFSREFKSAEENEDKYIAAIMYDDKMNLWTKGRFILQRTSPFLSLIKSTKDKVLPEIRYVSVAPGATRLHFLMTTLKRAFTSGTWIRWYYLEQNYYKKVAPVIAANMVKARGLQQPRDESETRPLNLDDLFSVFALKGFGCGFAFLICMFEMYTQCSYSEII